MELVLTRHLSDNSADDFAGSETVVFFKSNASQLLRGLKI